MKVKARITISNNLAYIDDGFSVTGPLNAETLRLRIENITKDKQHYKNLDRWQQLLDDSRAALFMLQNQS